jgi:hypothetical protein
VLLLIFYNIQKVYKSFTSFKTISSTQNFAKLVSLVLVALNLKKGTIREQKELK